MNDNDKVICPNCVHEFVAVPVNVQAKLTMENQKVVKLTSFDLPPRLITSIDAFDDAMVKAIDTVIESGVHREMIVGMLHAYAHEQSLTCKSGADALERRVMPQL